MAGLPKNLAGAFDLSTLATKRESEAQYMGIVLDRNNLVSEILPRSQNEVFIAVAWSPRSPQTLALIKTMAEFEAASAGKWNLLTVNVDEQPEVAQAFQISAIPLTVAIIGGQLVPLFESIPPNVDIEKTLVRLFELAAEQGVLTSEGDVSSGTVEAAQESAEPEEQLEPEEIEAMAALNNGDYIAAQNAYHKWVSRDPANPMAKAALAQVELLMRIGTTDMGTAITNADANPGDLKAALLAADIQLSMGEYEQAFDRLISFVSNSADPEKKIAKEHLIKLFDLVDAADPIVVVARRKLANALF
jgi:putative thioredoxin